MNKLVCNKYEYILSISSDSFLKILFSSGFIDTNSRKSQYDSKVIIKNMGMYRIHACQWRDNLVQI